MKLDTRSKFIAMGRGLEFSALNSDAIPQSSFLSELHNHPSEPGESG